VAGLPEMVEETVARLRSDLGVGLSDIVLEQFRGY
jgi:hypothetical protein